MQNDFLPVILCILDGWGIGDDNSKHNAIKLANTPNWDFLYKNFPSSILETSGEAVGLPEGQVGNSEVGHMTIGGGRVIKQDLVRINESISDGSLNHSPIIKNLISSHKNQNNYVHLIGLASDGGVHSHLEHLLYFIKLLADDNVKIKLHLFLDGRDTSPQSADKFLSKIDSLIKNYSGVTIASLSGRFYAMDRDKRFERTSLASDAIIYGKGLKIDTWQNYLDEHYQKSVNDEFMLPAAIGKYDAILENDSVFFFNFRSDRIIQLAETILASKLTLIHRIALTSYSEHISRNILTIFPEQDFVNCLGEVISKSEKKQLRIAETEKYAHVTYFFNMGKEKEFAGEDRILIPSPKVKTYDLQPEMSALELTNELIKALKSSKYDLIIVNYANADMVGHSGDLTATIKAIETLDYCLGQIYQEMKNSNIVLIISADHGNAENMHDYESNKVSTSHTLNPVPLLLVAEKFLKGQIKLANGNLSDIAPTILEIMKINHPSEMTGKSLVIKELDRNE